MTRTARRRTSLVESLEHRVLFARVERTGDEPSAEKDVVDVAVLDMNHGWANLGHESIVEIWRRKDGLAEYRGHKNATSISGLPGWVP